MPTVSDEVAPRVSVIMAVYAGDTLPVFQTAVEAICAQTFAQWECLLAQDGPVTDDVQTYITKLCAHDSRFRVVALPENRGPAAARNAAIQVARAPYVAIADADDQCAPNRLAEQLTFLETTQADVAGTFMRYIDDAGNGIATKTMPESPEDIRRKVLWFSPLNNPTVMARTCVLQNHPYDEKLRFAEDYDLWVRLLLSGCVLRNQPVYLYDMRLPARFYGKRRGWRAFRNDLRVRTSALKLFSAWLFPVLWPLAVAISGARLLPTSLLRGVYRVRNALRFSGDQDA